MADNAAGVSAILVGETDGTFRMLSTTPDVWTKFGLGFPNSSVWGVDYSTANNVLVAGTNCRGAFEVQNASADLFTAGILTINGDQDYANEDDTIKLIRDTNNPLLLDVYLNSTSPVASYPLDTIQQINVNTLGGNDTLIVDSTNGLIDVPNGIRNDGGTGDNSLELLQTGGPTQTSDTYTVIANPGQGSDVIVGASGTQTVDFQNLRPSTTTCPRRSLLSVLPRTTPSTTSRAPTASTRSLPTTATAQGWSRSTTSSPSSSRTRPP